MKSSRKKAESGCLEIWNAGMLLMYATFELVILIATYEKMALSTATKWYLLILAIILLVGASLMIKNHGLNIIQIKRAKFDKWELVLLILAIVGVLYQMIYVCGYTHIDDDDAYYVGMAVTSYFSDTISMYHPYLGTEVDLSVMANYVLSPYPIFSAMWAKLFAIHPAIFMRTVLPAVNIAWCYVVYGLLGKTLFKSKAQQLEFVIIVVLANLFGAYSGANTSMYLLTRVWQGKSVIAAILIPALWYLWIRLRRDTRNTMLWVLMALTVWSACLCSSMSLFLCPILLGAFGLEYLIEKRDWKNVGKLVLCAMPCLILAICELYLVYM